MLMVLITLILICSVKRNIREASEVGTEKDKVKTKTCDCLLPKNCDQSCKSTT